MTKKHIYHTKIDHAHVYREINRMIYHKIIQITGSERKVLGGFFKNDSLRKKFKMDKIDIMELLMEIEEELMISFNDDDWKMDSEKEIINKIHALSTVL